MKALINLVLLALLVSSCKSDREYIKSKYFSAQNQKDIEDNRYDLYRQSYVGIYTNSEAEEFDYHDY